MRISQFGAYVLDDRTRQGRPYSRSLEFTSDYPHTALARSACESTTCRTKPKKKRRTRKQGAAWTHGLTSEVLRKGGRCVFFLVGHSQIPTQRKYQPCRWHPAAQVVTCRCGSGARGSARRGDAAVRAREWRAVRCGATGRRRSAAVGRRLFWPPGLRIPAPRRRVSGPTKDYTA